MPKKIAPLKKERKRRGAPTIYSPELAAEFCKRISHGRSLRNVCKDPDMPDASVIFDWMPKYPEFAEQYARACEERTEAHNEILLDLGDDALAEAKKANPKKANAVVSAVKLKADNLRWVMSKQKPKKYGDKVDLTSGGEPIKGNTIVLKDFSGNDAGASTGSQ